MTDYIRNVLERPIYKLEDRRALAESVLAALQDDPDCRWDFKGEWKKLTTGAAREESFPGEEANWTARQHFDAVARSYPRSDVREGSDEVSVSGLRDAESPES